MREKAIIALGFYGHLRIGEICGMQKKYVDLKNNKISIEKKLYRGTIGPPKTDSSQATIYILNVLKKIIAEWLLQCSPGIWLFPGKKRDMPINGENWTRNYFKPLLKKYGIHIRFHDLRHLGATFLRERGMPLDFIQNQLRHASYVTTSDIYIEIPENQLKQELNRIDEFIFSFTTKKTTKIIEK